MEENNEIVEIRDKLSEIFRGINEIDNIEDIGNSRYRVTLDDGDEIFLDKNDLEEETIRYYYDEDFLDNRILQKLKSTKDSQLSIISALESYNILDAKYESSVVLLPNSDIFIINNSGLVTDKEGKQIEDKNILNKLKRVIEKNFIKTESVLNKKNLCVDLGIAEAYGILLNKVNSLENSENISISKVKEITLGDSSLDETNIKYFKANNLSIIIDIPECYRVKSISLSQILKMAEFKKHNGIKEQLEKFIKEKMIDKELSVFSIKKILEAKNDLTEDELKAFSNNINEIFHFVVKRDGEHNEIRHAANIVFSDDGKKYLIDSSLAAYEYLFVKDLALNEEENREYNVELFDTQKIVPGCDLTKIYSVQEGGSCKLWSVFLNVETNKMIKDNPGRDPIEVINNNFDEIFLNASLGMSELIDKKKAVLFEKPVGTDKSLYKPCNFNDKTIYVLSTDDSDLKSKCVKTDVLINMIHKHEVERIINEEIIKDNKVIDHDKFQQLSSLLDTMEKDGLNAYVKSVKERKPELGKMLDSTEVMRKESRLYKDKTKKLKEEFNRLMSQRPKFVSSGRKLEGKEKKLEEEKHKKIKTQLNKKRKEINKVKNYSNYWQQKASEQKKQISNEIQR